MKILFSSHLLEVRTITLCAKASLIDNKYTLTEQRAHT